LGKTIGYVQRVDTEESLAAAGGAAIRVNALRHAHLALVRAENALEIPADLAAAREAARIAPHCEQP
jgi:hypothetical protein